PVLKILNLRHAKTKGDRAKIEDLTVKTDALIKEYETKIKQAKIEALQMKEAIRREGEAQGQKIVHESKQAALTQIEKIKSEIAFEGKKATASLEEQAKNLSRELAQKVLGRTIDKMH
ncbi:MAG: ATP synthase F0 subunit B, partial [bacterium]|nr:ATP synthase F0 subunit B [bacterium]